jgi:hypothetical protein
MRRTTCCCCCKEGNELPPPHAAGQDGGKLAFWILPRNGHGAALLADILHRTPTGMDGLTRLTTSVASFPPSWKSLFWRLRQLLSPYRPRADGGGSLLRAKPRRSTGARACGCRWAIVKGVFLAGGVSRSSISIAICVPHGISSLGVTD